METLNQPQKMHIGRKICRIREIRGIKQEALAQELGITQQQVSRLEQSEVIEDEVLEKIAKVLGVTSDAVKNFSDEAMVNYFNTFNDHSVNQGAVYAFNSTFNPIDKLVEVFEENKNLYERLLSSEKEKVDILKGK
jgi:transcriptional regulator with XRE-family HTH domain